MPDIFYRRHLPHIHPDGYPLFITFRLANSLPEEIILELKTQRECEPRLSTGQPGLEVQEIEARYFSCYDEWLDKCATGPQWLENENIARTISEAILGMQNSRYKLIAYCIMPNHVHLLIENLVKELSPHRGKRSRYPVAETLRLLKGATARDCNLALKRNGQFWHHESYDHYVRDEAELSRIIKYILDNPVKAGLVKEWNNWKFTYVSPEFGKW